MCTIAAAATITTSSVPIFFSEIWPRVKKVKPF